MNFEITLFPILMIILGWGYQPERLSAGLALVIYTIIGSIPFLIYLILVTQTGHESFFQVKTSFTSGPLLEISFYLIMLAFLVKLPIFLFHIWLPKAHVEAPVYGSIFLAGTLLKLGGIGLIRFRLFLNQTTSEKFIFISCTSLVIVGLICSFNRDIKVIIAYSSVAHIALSLIMLLAQTEIRI